MCWYKDFIGVECATFLDELSRGEWHWLCKRLSGNDTGLTGAHQVGLYIPREFVKLALPEISTREVLNPENFLSCYFPCSDYYASEVRAVYYNNRYHLDKTSGNYGTRDESRLTRWGGRACPLQDVENTGAIILLAISGDRAICWVASSPVEEEEIQNFIGQQVDPSEFYVGDSATSLSLRTRTAGYRESIPAEWFEEFPSGMHIARLAIELCPPGGASADRLLLRRRQVESDIFFEVERFWVQPLLSDGFDSVDEFVKLANQVTNRRKSRSGRSLEIHLAAIFQEAALSFEEQAVTELGKRPDFLFPSKVAYDAFPSNGVSLFMMAAKTCCKDRWRQIINEADKIEEKHLFTLQEGVSANQLREMADCRVRLVIPQTHMTSFNPSSRSSLMCLEDFISVVRCAQSSA